MPEQVIPVTPQQPTTTVATKKKFNWKTLLLLIIISVVLVLLLILDGFTYIQKKNPKSNQFLNTLPGEIVYECINKSVRDICTISANGTGKKLVYHNSNSNVNFNSGNPKWEENGSKIYFSMIQHYPGGWQRYSINQDGSNLTKIANEQGDITTQYSTSSDLVVDVDTLFYLSKSGKIPIYTKKVSTFSIDAEGPTIEWASWSPDKKYIIFDTYSDIFVAKKDGSEVTKITEGSAANWKY